MLLMSKVKNGKVALTFRCCIYK